MTHPKKMKVAILGSGNIGTDLLAKIGRSQYLMCSLFIGRNPDSKGLKWASERGIATSDCGIDALVQDPDQCELVFDATSARDHIVHAPLLAKLGKKVIDMTPSRVGRMTVPAVDGEALLTQDNVNMISCGGQASIPLAYAISQSQEDPIDYIEVVSSISSKSAGPATRINLDEYIETTEAAIRLYTKCKKAKVILIINPAEPCIDMQTTLSAKVAKPRLEALNFVLKKMLENVRSYVPGYELVVPPLFETNRVFIMVRVHGLGDYLPPYAGNLDIINCAAIATAERFAQHCFEAMPLFDGGAP